MHCAASGKKEDVELEGVEKGRESAEKDALKLDVPRFWPRFSHR